MTQTPRASATHVQPPRPKRGFWGAVLAILLFWLLILALAAGAVAGLASIYNSNRILAGVQTLGRDLGGLTPNAAAALLQSDWQAHKIVLEAGAQSWTFSPDQIGAVLDAEATAKQAFRQGRVEPTQETVVPLARRLLASAGLIADAEAVPAARQAMSLAQRLLASAGLIADAEAATALQAVWHFDRAAGGELLRTLASQLEIIPLDAGLRIVDGQIEATPPTTGRAVDIAAMLATLERQPWDTLLTGPASEPLRFTLPIVSRPPAITDVSGVVSEVAPLLAAPITLRLYDPIRDERMTWTAEPTDMGQWLTFQTAVTDTQKSLSWSVDEDKVAAFIETQNATFGDERYVNSDVAAPALAAAFRARQAEISQRVSHGEREHIVKSGETLSSIAFDYGMPYPWLLKVNAGIGDNLFVGDKIRIPSVDGLLPLPVVENKRIKVSLKDQRMQAYEDGKLKWDWIGSTGIASSPTSPGVFQIQTHEPMAYAARWNLYMPWFMGIYRPVPDQDFMNGFHGFPSRDQKQFLWERNLGRPITYGCILVDTKNAKLLYDWAEEGVVVEITP